MSSTKEHAVGTGWRRRLGKPKPFVLFLLFLFFTVQAGIAAIGYAAARGEELTIERMYSDPRLTGVTPRHLAWSPDGRRLAFLWNNEGVRFYDIWIYDASSGKLSRATDAAAIGRNAEEAMTRAEQDRLATFRRRGGGIFSFEWSPDGRSILFPFKGDIFLLDVKSGSLRRLTNTAVSEADAAFSPDGSKVAFIRENNIWVIDLDRCETVQLTDTGSETLYNGIGDYVDYEEVGRSRSFWWSPDGTRIAYVQVDVSPIRELLIPRYIGRFVEVRKQLRPVAGGKNGLERIGILDVKAKKTTWIRPTERRDVYFCQVHWNPDGCSLLVLEEPRDMKHLHFIKANAQDGSIDTLRTITDDKWVNIDNVYTLWTDEGKRLLFTSEENGWNHLYRMDLSTGKVDRLTSGDWQITALHKIDGRGRIWFTSTAVEPEQRHLFYLDGKGRIYKVTNGEGWYSSVIAKDAKRIAVTYSNPSTPPDIYILKDLKGKRFEASGSDQAVRPKKSERGGGSVPVLFSYRTGWPVPEHLKRVTFSPAPDFKKIRIALPYFFKLKSRLDGETVNALIIFPPEMEKVDPVRVISNKGEWKGKKYPAIIAVHGGGYYQSVFKGWRWQTLFDTYLADKGFVVLDLDYRGSSGYGRKFRTDVYLDLAGPDLEDEVTGAEFLKSLPFIEPDRVGIWGWSYGGFMTAAALLKRPGVFYAGAAVAPVTDWRCYDTHYTEERLGMPQDNEEAYRRSSPISFADSLRDHLLIIHGVGDDNVHFQDTVKLVDKLIKTKVDFEVMFYPGSQHGIRTDESRIHLFRKIARHFERYLKGIPDAECK